MFRTMAVTWLAALLIVSQAPLAQTPQAQAPATPAPSKPAGTSHAHPRDISAAKGYGSRFETSDRCFACHNGMSTSTGEDLSIGLAWRTSMMGNSGRDPYWMAGVRREITDHPMAEAAIQDECTICHMPMMRYENKRAGGQGDAFSHLPPDLSKRSDQLSHDGVSCSVCHQITPEGLGTRQSFVGGFKIDEQAVGRRMFGPFEIDKARTTIMHSSSTYTPTKGDHIRSSELCATCHTLITDALDKDGKTVGELPEQVPYQEWLHSDYKTTRSCQSCHMPVVTEDVPASSVFGEPRSGFSRHTFLGGNFFMQRILNRFGKDLGVTAEPSEMEAAAERTVEHLKADAARVTVRSVDTADARLTARIAVENLGGHKLPTAYPSRRAWLHVTVRDRNGRAIFESGALSPTGAIQGNDNDADATRFEPHYTEITQPEQVQIYEPILVDPQGALTTGLLTAVRYAKDNRLLPHGFDKTTADKDVAVHGDAERDPDFQGGGDEIRYVVPVGSAEGPFTVQAELWYQPIGFRWAMNLKNYQSMEPQRFVGYYEQTAGGSGVMLATTNAATR